MSFIFYINNGFATMATVEQFQGYYQNVSNIYSNADELYPASTYCQTWTHSDLYTQNDTIAPQISQTVNENHQTQAQRPQSQP
jgi:hypothetical protein